MLMMVVVVGVDNEFDEEKEEEEQEGEEEGTDADSSHIDDLMDP
jgi:hypothetical protein